MGRIQKTVVGVCLLALLALAGCAKHPGGDVSGMSSWNVLTGDVVAVVRARVQDQGAVQEHVVTAEERYQVVPFTLEVTEVIKPSTRGEKPGDRLVMWIDAKGLVPPNPRGTPLVDLIKPLVGQEAVFALHATDGTGSWPEGYTLYAIASYWAIAGDRVTGGADALTLHDAPYAELVQKVRNAVDGK